MTRRHGAAPSRRGACAASRARLLFALAVSAAAFVRSPREARAQQSLFNVPAGHSTARGALFGQQQLTLTPSAGEANSTLQVGLTNEIELGVNVFHVPLYALEAPAHGGPAGLARQAPSESTVQANLGATVSPARYLTLQGGVAAGVGTHPTHGAPEPVLFAWLVSHWTAPGRAGSYVLGAYAGSPSALGRGHGMGLLLGAEVPIVPERLHLMGDWIVGTNAISVAVLGIVGFFGPNVQLSAGVQLPSPASENEPGAVLELTWVPEEWSVIHAPHTGVSPHAGHAHAHTRPR